MCQKARCIVAVLLLFSSIVIAQQKVEYGVRTGLNISTFVGDFSNNVQDLSARANFHVGGVLELHLLERLSLQPELSYSRQGVVFDQFLTFNAGSSETSSTIKLDYINIPLLAKFYVVKDVLSLGCGPQLGIRVNAEQEVRGGSVVFPEADISDFFEPIDLSLDFELAAKLESGLNFGLRFGLGLTNINDVETVDDKNAVFQLSVGYFFK